MTNYWRLSCTLKGETPYKMNKKLNVGSRNVWIHKHEGWRPEQVTSDREWEEAGDIGQAALRHIFPDPRKDPYFERARAIAEDDGTTPQGEGTHGIASGDDLEGVHPDDALLAEWDKTHEFGCKGDAQLDPAGDEFAPLQYNKNHLIEKTFFWIYWRIYAAKGVTLPDGCIIRGDDEAGPKTASIFHGERISRLKFKQDDQLFEADDDWMLGKSAINASKDPVILKMLSEPLSGPTLSRKYNAEYHKTHNVGGSSGSGSGEVAAETVVSINNVSVAPRRKRKIKRVNFIHKRFGEQTPMIDATIPCVQEHENWPNAAMDMRQRSALEELDVCEREVYNRYWVCKDKDIPKSEVAEKSELCGLEVHSDPPRLLNDTDFRDDDSFANHSRLSRRRQKSFSSPVLPHS
jgi:hypothetical protein